MAYEIYAGAPDDQQAKVAYLIQLFQSARNQRLNFEPQWEESAALIWPEYRNSFSFGHVRSPGVKYTQYQVDSSLTIRAQRFMAIADAMITPFNLMWSIYRSPDVELMKQRDAKLYYEAVTRTIWAERYKATAGFTSQQTTGWMGLGVFGNHGMMVEEYDGRPLDRGEGLSYTGCSVGEIYLLVNHQNRVDGFVRHFRWTARQAHQRWPGKIPPQLQAAMERADNYTLWDFLQFVIPRHDYMPEAFAASSRAKPWSSIYVSVPYHGILEEGGYWSFPLAHGRYMQAPEEWYGRGWAQQVLPEAKTKNTEKEAFLRQGKLAGDPFYLLPKDDLYDFKAVSGEFYYGGVNEGGSPMVHTIQAGNIAITKELMEDSDKILDAASLNDLFGLLFNKDNAQKTAREVIEITNNIGIFLAPTLGRQYGEYCSALAGREYNVLERQGKFKNLPGADLIKEAGTGVHCQFVSPLARAIDSQGIAGFMRSVELTSNVVQMTGDDSYYDVYDFDVSQPEIADMQFAPARWMAAPDKIAQKRKQRAAAKERENQVKEMPGRAAMLKAQAIIAKAQTGGNIGGTLSGTPEGGMPMVPPQTPPGMPGQPGVGNAPGLPGRAGRPGL